MFQPSFEHICYNSNDDHFNLNAHPLAHYLRTNQNELYKMRGRSYTVREIPWPPNRPSDLDGAKVLKLFSTREFNKAWEAGAKDFKKLAMDPANDPLGKAETRQQEGKLGPP